MTKRRVIGLVITALVIISFFIFKTKQSHQLMNGIQELPDEKNYYSRAISSALKIITSAQADTAPSPYRRDAHAKAHGCVKATFTVPELNNPILEHGVFSEPKQFEAWIRFSNGFNRPQADKDKDARGMAIKVMGVPGEKLLKAEMHEQTQDFVMLNNPTFFLPNVKEYAKFIRYQAEGSQFGFFFNDFSWDIFKWHFQDLFLGTKILKKAPKSLLDEQYHSLTAYRLGMDNFMKFSAKSCDSNKNIAINRNKENFLRTELEEQLKAGDACFDFMVQVQNPQKNMPIEDTRVLWETKDSPFISVARIEIPQQSFNTELQNQFCENLSFTPWHATSDLEPVGGLNRLRKFVYTETSRFRHGKNDVERHEPKGWCLVLDGKECP
jgi:catalase